MDRYTAQLAIITAHNVCVSKARAEFPTYIKAAPRATFDLKGRTCGGRAKIGANVIQYNLDWYAADPAKYLAEIIPHEVAHIVAHATGLGKGHNYGWVMIDRRLGGVGQRLSAIGNLARKARVTNQFLYADSRGNPQWVGAVHHNRLQKRGPISNYRLMTPQGTRITHDGFQNQKRLAA